MSRIEEDKAIEMLKRIKRIFDKHNITYWLDEGTLLGAVRDKKLIEWDHDVDLSIWYKDVDKIKPLYGKIQRAGFEICFFEGKKHIKLLGKGYEIDINLYHRVDGVATRKWHVANNMGKFLDYLIWVIHLKDPNNREFNTSFRITKMLVGLSNRLPNIINKGIIKTLYAVYETKGCSIYQVSIPAVFFEKFTLLDFYGMKFKVPKRTKEYLEYRYGSTWQIPKRDYLYYVDDQAVVKDRGKKNERETL